MQTDLRPDCRPTHSRPDAGTIRGGPQAGLATVVEDVGHTYAQAGSYTAIFKYEAGPFSCVDSVTGVGDRPYSSSAVGTVAVVVR